MTDKEILRARRERLQREEAGPVARETLDAQNEANRLARQANWISWAAAATATVALLKSFDVI